MHPSWNVSRTNYSWPRDRVCENSRTQSTHSEGSATSRRAWLPNVDIGAESTRPGHTPVDEFTELARLICALSQSAILFQCKRRVARRWRRSIDTSKVNVYRRPHAAGGDMLNRLMPGARCAWPDKFRAAGACPYNDVSRCYKKNGPLSCLRGSAAMAPYRNIRVVMPLYLDGSESISILGSRCTSTSGRTGTAFSSTSRGLDGRQITVSANHSTTECAKSLLNPTWFRSLHDARREAAAWRHDYNTNHPHSPLDNLSPEEFARQAKKKAKIAVNSGAPAG
jgi:transposase InsO family protein